MKKLPYRRRPCKECPFKKSCMPQWLGYERMSEICNAVSFVCHKNNKMQCAGHMILMGPRNHFVSVANSMNIKLDLSSKDVFNSIEECLFHHSYVCRNCGQKIQETQENHDCK